MRRTFVSDQDCSVFIGKRRERLRPSVPKRSGRMAPWRFVATTAMT